MKTIDLIAMKHSIDGKATDLPYSKQPGQNFTLFLEGDSHVGNVGIDDKKIESLVKAVKSKKNAFVVNMGDNLESINIKDIRYSLAVHGCRGSMIQAQRDSFIERFDAIGDRFLNVTDGNHELKFKNDFKPNADIAKEFGSVYVDGTMSKLIFPEFRLCAWHGAGNVSSSSGDELQRKTNELIALKRKLRKLPANDCEFMAMGHVHKLLLHLPTDRLIAATDREKLDITAHYSQPGRIDVDKDKGLYRVHDDDKYYIGTGSFLKGYIEGISTYVEEMGLGMTELGWVEIEVKNGKPCDIVLRKSL